MERFESSSCSCWHFISPSYLSQRHYFPAALFLVNLYCSNIYYICLLVNQCQLHCFLSNSNPTHLSIPTHNMLLILSPRDHGAAFLPPMSNTTSGTRDLGHRIYNPPSLPGQGPLLQPSQCTAAL